VRDLDPDAYRELFDANPLPMFVSDRETLQILMVNRAACERYGWSREELLTMSIRDIRPPEEVPVFEASFADPTKDPSARYSRIGRHRTKDGRIIDVTLQISGVTVGGRPASLAVITDVTGIAQAERRFRLLVEHGADGISVINEDNIVEYVSPGGCKILGYAADKMIGALGGSMAHPDDRGQWTAPAPGESRYHVARVQHADGTWRWIESTTTNLTHEPAVRAFVSNYRDITERKLVEASLRRSEANFRSLIERVPTAILVHRHGRFLYINPAGVAMFGCRSADELIGRAVLDFVHPDDREAIGKRQAQLRETGNVPAGTGRMLRADGSVFVIEVDALRLEFDGEPANVVMGHDVTERDQMFTRMALADRMLSIGTLAAGVAHEINNPLAYVATNLEILAAELPNIQPSRHSRLSDVTLHSLVTDARDGVARVSAIVRDLRSLSRPDDGQPHGPVDVVATLASSLKMVHNEIRHRARIVQSYADELPLVDADASRLGQVFINLLLNAAQAIPEGHADRNEIALRAFPLPGARHIRVEVADTGSGIPQSIIRRIFDPFFTTRGPGGGTGLGLSISHQIVGSLGGELTVESEPGKGSTFRVTLPVGATQIAAPPEARPVRNPKRILLVDDEPAVGRSLATLLAPETEVIAVLRAEDALARLTGGERFDVIVCDLMMPEITGIELYERLARVAPDCTGRIIFMTGGAFTPQAREFLAKLDRPHLEKPFSEAQLRRALDRMSPP